MADGAAKVNAKQYTEDVKESFPEIFMLFKSFENHDITKKFFLE